MSDLRLEDRHCTPLSGKSHRLDAGKIAAALRDLPDWALVEDGQALVKSFHFDDYFCTMAFVNALAHVAHREDHHPDLGVHYNRCVVRFSTHDAGGVTDNDLICAAKAERLYAD